MSYSKEKFIEERAFGEEPDALPEEWKGVAPTKSNITLLATQIATQIADGKVDALEAVVKLRAMQNVCEEAIEAIKVHVLKELEKHPKEKAIILGCEIESMEAGVKYDFTENADWVNFNKTLIETKEEMKKIEKVLKSIAPGKDLVDKETGEVLTGAAKTSTTTIKITLAE